MTKIQINNRKWLPRRQKEKHLWHDKLCTTIPCLTEARCPCPPNNCERGIGHDDNNIGIFNAKWIFKFITKRTRFRFAFFPVLFWPSPSYDIPHQSMGLWVGLCCVCNHMLRWEYAQINGTNKCFRSVCVSAKTKIKYLTDFIRSIGMRCVARCPTWIQTIIVWPIITNASGFNSLESKWRKRHLVYCCVWCGLWLPKISK